MNALRTAVLGFLASAAGNGDRFDAHVGEDRYDDRAPHAEHAIGEEAAIGCIVMESEFVARVVEDQPQRDDDEGDDGKDLDCGEPVFGGSEDLHAGEVHAQERSGKDKDPEQSGDFREPVLHVLAHGADLGAHGEDQRGPVQIFGQVSGKTAQVAFGVDPEGSGHRLLDGHFRQRAHDQQRYGSANEIADDHRRAGHRNGELAAREEAGADGTAQGDHGHLPWCQRLLKTRTDFSGAYRLLAQRCSL